MNQAGKYMRLEWNDNRVGKLLANAVLFQIIWFIAVQANNIYALMATAFFLVIHSSLFMRSKREWMLILLVSSIGYTSDTLFNTFGFFTFSNSYPFNVMEMTIKPAPVWIWCLWLAFSATLCHSLNWLKNRLPLAALLGLIAVPITYYAGARFSGSIISEPILLPLLLQGFVWASLLPWALNLTRTAFDAHHTRTPQFETENIEIEKVEIEKVETEQKRKLKNNDENHD